MSNKNKLVFGVGINDSNYVVQVKKTVGVKEDGTLIKKVIWSCPFYSRWADMLKRCYSETFQIKYPTYQGCSTISEWHRFTKFKSWMETQNWEGKSLDKDILFNENKIYGPDTCVFVDKNVNTFIVERQNHRGEWPIGVHFNKKLQKFQALCKDVTTGKRRHLGLYDYPYEAHQAWLAFKLEQAKILADQQGDPRVAKALIERYTNYK